MKFALAFLFLLLSGGAQAQETMEFKSKDFEAQLQQYMDSKATGIEVSPKFASAVSDDIQKAVGVVADTTDFIAEKLCKRPSRPTKITLNLTAGFNLVFSGETGSEVEWDLEAVCPRYNQR